MLREDLLGEVAKITYQGTFDYLIFESTGVSEPMPIAETFTFKDSKGLCLGDIAQIDTLGLKEARIGVTQSQQYCINAGKISQKCI